MRVNFNLALVYICSTVINHPLQFRITIIEIVRDHAARVVEVEAEAEVAVNISVAHRRHRRIIINSSSSDGFTNGLEAENVG